MLDKWEGIAVQVAAAGTSFEITSYLVWPSLTAERFSRVLQLRSLSYSNVAGMMNALPTLVWGWKRELEGGGAITLHSRDSALLNIQLTMAAKLPDLVTASEARAVLPPPGRAKYK